MRDFRLKDTNTVAQVHRLLNNINIDLQHRKKKSLLFSPEGARLHPFDVRTELILHACYYLKSYQ